MEKIVDSRAVVRRNIFTQFPPAVTFCKTMVQYHNQDIHSAIMHWFCSNFPTGMIWYVALGIDDFSHSAEFPWDSSKSCVSFYCCLVLHGIMRVLLFVEPFTCWGTFWAFPVLSIMNSAVMKILVEALVHIQVLSFQGLVPRGAMTELFGSCMPRNWHAVSQNGCTFFHSPPAMCKLPTFSVFQSAFRDWCYFFSFCSSEKCVGISHCGFKLRFSDGWCLWTSYCCGFAICVSSPAKKCLFVSFAIF